MTTFRASSTPPSCWVDEGHRSASEIGAGQELTLTRAGTSRKPALRAQREHLRRREEADEGRATCSRPFGPTLDPGDAPRVCQLDRRMNTWQASSPARALRPGEHAASGP